MLLGEHQIDLVSPAFGAERLVSSFFFTFTKAVPFSLSYPSTSASFFVIFLGMEKVKHRCGSFWPTEKFATSSHIDGVDRGELHWALSLDRTARRRKYPRLDGCTAVFKPLLVVETMVCIYRPRFFMTWARESPKSTIIIGCS